MVIWPGQPGQMDWPSWHTQSVTSDLNMYLLSTCDNVPLYWQPGLVWVRHCSWGIYEAIQPSPSHFLPYHAYHLLTRGGMEPGIHTSHPPRTAPPPHTGHWASLISNMYWCTRSYHFIFKDRLCVGPGWTFIGKLLIFHSCQLCGYLVGTTHSVTIHPTPARGWWCGGSLVWTGPGWCVLRLRPVSHAAPRHLAPTAAAQPTAACTDTAAHGDTSHIPSHLQLLCCPKILLWRLHNHGEGPKSAFSWLKVPTSAFTLKTIC